METIVTHIDEAKRILSQADTIRNCIFLNLHFSEEKIPFHECSFRNCTFLGCTLSKEDVSILLAKNVFIFPAFKKLPYNPYRNKLYTWQELLDGFSEDNDVSADFKIYTHFIKTKYSPPLLEALAQRIHDNFIDEHLRDVIGIKSNGKTEKKVVAFMGGHSTPRGDVFYTKTALAAQLLAKEGFYVATGGGPGIMEAANLGAYFAKYTSKELKEAISILKESPTYHDAHYFQQSQVVLERFPNGTPNIAIPTWFYGHEPTNVFASDIAKYFSNSIREDNLLAFALYGIVFAPGSAGTTQEIFQEAAQNHYGTFGYYSPMIFFSKKRYVEDTSLYSVLHQLAMGKKYKDLLFVTDDEQSIVAFIKKNPPIKAK